MTSSPGSTRARSVAAIASVAPQVTVSSASGFTSIPYHSRYFRATASRSRLAPQVMAYWLMSARMAAAAASLSTAGGGESGHPADDRLGERVGAAGGAHRGAARFRLPNLTPVGPIGTDPAGGAGCRPGAAGSCDDGSPAARAYGTRTFPG